MRTVPPPLPALPVNSPPPSVNPVTWFYGKTWVLTAQFLMFGGFAAFALAMGPLFLLGVIKDARGESAKGGGVVLTLMGLALTPVALVAGYVSTRAAARSSASAARGSSCASSGAPRSTTCR